VLREIVRLGHDVVALARSDGSASKIAKLGAVPIAGDIETPEKWIGNLPLLQTVIHLAPRKRHRFIRLQRSLGWWLLTRIHSNVVVVAIVSGASQG
jgi:uncharacterized protein YbjT (DUF2867 family)